MTTGRINQVAALRCASAALVRRGGDICHRARPAQVLQRTPPMVCPEAHGSGLVSAMRPRKRYRTSLRSLRAAHAQPRLSCPIGPLPRRVLRCRSRDDAAQSPPASRDTPPSRQAAAAAQILHMVRMLQAALAARHLTHVATRYVKALRNGTSCPTTVELRRKAAADMRLPAANRHGLAQASGTQALGSGTRPHTRYVAHLCTHASAFAGLKFACLALTRRTLLDPCILTSSPHNYGVNLSK